VDTASPAIGGFDLITAAKLVIDSSRRLTWSSYVTDPFTYPHLLSAKSTDNTVDTPTSNFNTVSVLEPSAQSSFSAALEQPSLSAAHAQPTAHVQSSLLFSPTAHPPLDTDTTLLKVLTPSLLSTPPHVDSLTSQETRLPDHLTDLYDDITDQPNFPPDLKSELHCFFIKHCDTFAKSSDDLGFCEVLEHDIDTGDARPIKQPPRRPPLSQGNVENELLDDMLATGVIEPSNSPWASPVTLVKKPDGSFRFCVDYRRLNAVSKSDAFPLPSIQDALDHLQGAKWFATIDLLSGYWQLGMTERAKEASAFCTRRGLFHFTRMPFGLKGSPSTFCRTMGIVLRDLLWTICLCYLDDIIVYGRTPQELLERLDIVLSRLATHGLKAKPTKCSLFKQEIKFLGHLVSSRGTEPLPEKIQDIKDRPAPRCLKELRAFYGLASYYRKFVKNFATLAEPLSRLTKKGTKFVWSDEAQKSFEALKTALVDATTLAFPLPDRQCILDTDASDVAIGAVLSQMIDGQERPIAFFSRVLNQSQRNYCPTRRELLAVIASMQHFRHYLLNNHVVLRTDHHSLKWLRTFKQPEGILARWLETLAEFDFSIEHRPGRLHCNADGLSRPLCKQCWGRVPKTPWVDELDRANEITDSLRVHALQLLPECTDQEIGKMQEDDPALGPVRSFLLQHVQPTPDDLRALPPDSRKLWSQCPAVALQGDVLVRYTDTVTQLVVPESLRQRLFSATHAGPLAAHLGAERTVTQLQQLYYWPGMRKDVTAWCHLCDTCTKAKGPPSRAHAPMQKVLTGAPLDIVAIDILSGLPTSTEGLKYILVATDYFTKWSEAYALPDQEAATCMNALYNNLFARFGLPRQLHSDQGPNFESRLVTELCKITGVHRTRTTPFHPRSDGQTERMNRTLLQMLRTTASDHPRDWPGKLHTVMAAYRMTKHSTTSVTPNRAMLGREVLLPAAMIAAPPEEPHTVTIPWVEQFRTTIREAHQRVRASTRQTARTQKSYFDARVRPLNFSRGDNVWLYWPRPVIRQSQRKLQKLWTGPWQIIEIKSHVVVRIKHIKTRKTQTVHVDRLIPCRSPNIQDSAPDSTQTLSLGSSVDSTPNQSQSGVRENAGSTPQNSTPSPLSQPTLSLRRSNRNRRRPLKYMSPLSFS